MVKTWQLQRLSRGSGKARWHTVAEGPEYLIKTLGVDASRGAKTFLYRVVDPDGRKLEWWPTGATIRNGKCFELAYAWVIRSIKYVGETAKEKA